MPEETDQKTGGAVERGIEFHFIKSTQFRVIHADGAYGGISAGGYLNVAFYNERRAIPQTTAIVVDEEAGTISESVIATRGGVVREVEIDVIMDEVAVAQLVNWLQGKLVELRNVKRLMDKGLAEENE